MPTRVSELGTKGDRAAGTGRVAFHQQRWGTQRSLPSFHRVLPTPHMPPPHPRPSFPLTWAQTTFHSVQCAVGCQGEESPTRVGQRAVPRLLALGGLGGSQAGVVPTTSPWTRRTWETNWAPSAWQSSSSLGSGAVRESSELTDISTSLHLLTPHSSASPPRYSD